MSLSSLNYESKVRYVKFAMVVHTLPIYSHGSEMEAGVGVAEQRTRLSSRLLQKTTTTVVLDVLILLYYFEKVRNTTVTTAHIQTTLSFND